MIRILFIDDDPAYAEEMKFLLKQNGFDVVTANDGQDAFGMVKEHHFDLVITDMLMNKSHGMEVIAHMREFYPKIKIITISGGGWASPAFHLDSARLFGSDGCLAKPFKIEVLLKEIRRVMTISDRNP
ncbi:MAG: response regulator [bacterium]